MAKVLVRSILETYVEIPDDVFGEAGGGECGKSAIEDYLIIKGLWPNLDSNDLVDFEIIMEEK